MIETRKNLMGSVAIQCDGQNCHMEHVSYDEASARIQAVSDGWSLTGTDGATCPDCVAGNNPAEAVEGFQQAQPEGEEGEEGVEATPEHHQLPPPEEDDDDDEEVVAWQDVPVLSVDSSGNGENETIELEDDEARLDRQEEERLALSEKHMDADIAAYNPDPEKPAKKEKPFSFDNAGDTLPGLTEKAEDVESPADQEKRERREKRQRERQRAASRDTNEKTRAAMGGVEDMLKDFDGGFGKNNTWDGD